MKKKLGFGLCFMVEFFGFWVWNSNPNPNYLGCECMPVNDLKIMPSNTYTNNKNYSK